MEDSRNITLIPKKQTKKEERADRLIKTHALLAIKYGRKRHRYDEGYSERQIASCWNYDERPPSARAFVDVSVPELKEFIREHIVLNHPIWNSDFLHGLSKNAFNKEKKSYFPIMKWRFNHNIDKIVLECPLGGTIGTTVGKYKNIDLRSWRHIPALCLPYSDQSCSYVAGLLSAGMIHKEENRALVRYRKETTKELRRLGIPFEKTIHRGKGGYLALISPFWPALFSPLMPKVISGYWCGIKKAHKASEYAAIMWRTYSAKDFKKGAIPFLRSRRSVYYDFKCEEGAIKRIEDLRFEYNLAEITLTVREMVNRWENL